MKHKIFLCILIFITVFTSFISAATIADVPTNHWAFEDVKFTVDKGLFELYEDGTFRGSDNVSRYQIAVLVARLLEEIDGGNISTSEEDMELLRKLSVEFQEELVDLALKGDVFTEQIKTLEQKNLIQDEFLTEIKDIDIASLNERISNAERDVTSIIDSILKLKEIEEKLLLIEKASNEQAIIVKENQKQIEDLKEINLQFTDETIQSLNDRITINATRLNSLQDELTTVRSELELKNIEIEKLEVENKNYKNYLYGIGAVSLILLLLSN